MLLGAACSGGATFGSRSGDVTGTVLAAGDDAGGVAATSVSAAPGQNTDVFDPEKFCDDGYKIQICFTMVNRTSAFSKPFVLTDRVPLTVSRFCSGNGYPAELGAFTCSGGWGELACYNRTGVNCEGRLTPNPFTDVAGMLFVNNGANSGASPTLYVNGLGPPFATKGSPAKVYFSSPYNGSNEGNATSGTYIAAELDPTSFTASTWLTSPRFIFTDRPVRIRVQNSTPNVTLKSAQDPIATNFLVDPAAASANASSIGSFSSAFLGGYRAVTGSSSLILKFVIADPNGNTAATSGCPECGQAVTITFSFDGASKSANPADGSNCVVTNSTAIGQYQCSGPGTRVDGDDSVLTFTVDFREGLPG